jgi:D-alanyl-D-alanine carboxypeptidase
MLGRFRYVTRCGTVSGHTGSFPGYRLFAAATANGKPSVVFSVNSQIVPGQGSQEVSDLIRHAQEDASATRCGVEFLSALFRSEH